MTTPEKPAKRYNLLASDYDRDIPALLSPRDLGKVTDKGMLYMIYRETRRTRVILQAWTIACLVSSVLGLLFLLLALVISSDSS